MNMDASTQGTLLGFTLQQGAAFAVLVAVACALGWAAVALFRRLVEMDREHKAEREQRDGAFLGALERLRAAYDETKEANAKVAEAMRDNARATDSNTRALQDVALRLASALRVAAVVALVSLAAACSTTSTTARADLAERRDETHAERVDRASTTHTDAGPLDLDVRTYTRTLPDGERRTLKHARVHRGPVTTDKATSSTKTTDDKASTALALATTVTETRAPWWRRLLWPTLAVALPGGLAVAGVALAWRHRATIARRILGAP